LRRWRARTESAAEFFVCVRRAAQNFPVNESFPRESLALIRSFLIVLTLRAVPNEALCVKFFSVVNDGISRDKIGR